MDRQPQTRKEYLMNTIKMVPNNDQANTVTLSSHSYSVILLCLAAHGFVNDECDCSECDLDGSITFEKEDIPQLAEALADICSRMIDAGLRDNAIETAFLLSALPSSGGMRAEKIDN